MRAIVAETLVDLPMLRSVERRMVLEVRPNVDWNRAHAVEWLVSSVVEQVWPRLDRAASPKPEPALPENAPPPVETWDHWLHRYHRFMTPEEMREHLALPAGKRLLARRQRLADLEARRVLLDRVRERLDREEIEAFYQLPTYAACEAFVAALAPVPKNAGAAPGEPARGAERSPPG